MKCMSCDNEAEYDSSLEYNTARGIQVIHGNYCEKHMNLILTEFVSL